MSLDRKRKSGAAISISVRVCVCVESGPADVTRSGHEAFRGSWKRS